MDRLITLDDVRSMSVEQLLDELAGEEDLDDIIEVELQRRTLSHLRLMSVALLALMTVASLGLVLVVLFFVGLVGRPQTRGSLGRDWFSWVPFCG